MADKAKWFVAKVRRTGAHKEEQRPLSGHVKTKEEAETERDRLRTLPENKKWLIENPGWTIEVRIEKSSPPKHRPGNFRRR